jgi:hypothetical protein
MKETLQEQFIRIAMARLKPNYRFKPQRSAMAAHMYRRWLDRQIAQ